MLTHLTFPATDFERGGLEGIGQLDLRQTRAGPVRALQPAQEQH